ncbi:hypothetical protein GCM10018962_73600 [Dactylosporangium matsuzakiense]|uniref:Ricin B lectin domain-containing protein n=2 Tax=Dactylosporangium matsuzakiense TaxID=53360 RepID=A0A9W6KNR3_9ACTN|nr:hypothetical protein GCM10017581_060370 [Dactylosporangium matsuzakiense]
MLKKLAFALTLTLAAITGVVVVGGGSAAWAGYNNIALQSRMDYRLIMEVPGWSVGSGMTIHTNWTNSTTASSGYAGTNQLWSVPTYGTGYISNMHSNMCIETDGLAGDAVYQWPCNGSAHQQWRFDELQEWDWTILNYDHFLHIVNPASGLALNIRGGNTNPGATVIGWPVASPDSSNQDWYLNARI